MHWYERGITMTMVCILCEILLSPQQPPNNDDDILLLPRKHRRLPQRKLSNILDLKKPKHLRLLNLQQPIQNMTKFDCVHTKTKPPFPICVYEASKDKYISGALLSGGIWEPYITEVFQRALSKYPESTLIDIGANIGYYSLLAVHMHRSVIAIEPQWDNIQRLHKGAQLSGSLDRIELLHNALSNTHENVSLTDNLDNQGGIQVKPIQMGIHARDKTQVETIIMDDLLQIADFTQAIIKIDIEGYECKAMAEAKKFLDKIYVPYIFMEWKQMFTARNEQDSPCPMVAMETLAKYLTSRGYVPHEARTGFLLNPQLASSAWRIGDLYWRHKSASRLQADF
ncbi:unnamed protein product [Owenia fusiformis]|uniref:Uncharacterized protein n=1 Tax=Owenia fusiformis TaxID=6347 RepID=A0A8J1Y7P7_OWEFU|nr:unnamed protein product [Owenia fusiformis]